MAAYIVIDQLSVTDRERFDAYPEGATAAVKRYGGRTWATTKLTITEQPLFSLACPGTNDCYVSGFLLTGARQAGPGPGVKGLATTHDGGLTWKVHTGTTPMSHGYFTLACPAVTRCYAGGYGIWVRSTNGGQTWAVKTLRFPGYAEPPSDHVAPTDFIQSLSCTDLSTC